jgi:hypothetical protein
VIVIDLVRRFRSTDRAQTLLSFDEILHFVGVDPVLREEVVAARVRIERLHRLSTPSISTFQAPLSLATVTAMVVSEVNAGAPFSTDHAQQERFVLVPANTRITPR